MKHAKKFGFVFISTLLLSVLLLSTAALPVLAEPIPADALRWKSYTAEDGTEGVMITGYTGKDPVWEFPATIDGKPVLRLDTLHSLESDPAFSDTTTKEIIVPEGVQEINYAFAMYTALEKVTLPQSLKSIGMYSFYNCSALKEINFPAGLETIGSDAFDGCKQLETVSLPDSVTKLGEYAFSGCASLKELRLSAGIKQIPEYAFDGCTSLTSVVIPEGVERIGISAFDDSLKTITLPKSLTYVDMNGFAYSDLEKVIYNGTKQEFEKIDSYMDQLNSIECPIEYNGGTSGDPSQNGGPADGETNVWVPIIIGIVVIVLAAGGSVAVFLFMKRKNNANR